MFGEGYEPVEGGKKLEDGIYEAKIVKAEGFNGNYGAYVKCTVQVKDNPNAMPNLFFINDSPKQGAGNYTKEQLHEMWCKSTTAFFDSFKIQRGNFNINQWVGAVGKVTVRPQKARPEYSEIVPYETSIKKKEQKQNNNVFGASYPQQNNNGFEVSNPGTEQNNGGFLEDIPF